MALTIFIAVAFVITAYSFYITGHYKGSVDQINKTENLLNEGLDREYEVIEKWSTTIDALKESNNSLWFWQKKHDALLKEHISLQNTHANLFKAYTSLDKSNITNKYVYNNKSEVWEIKSSLDQPEEDQML